MNRPPLRDDFDDLYEAQDDVHETEETWDAEEMFPVFDQESGVYVSEGSSPYVTQHPRQFESPNLTLSPPPLPAPMTRVSPPNNRFAAQGLFIERPEKPQWPKLCFVCKDLGIAVGPPTILIAQSFSSKSFLAQDLALCVATGLPLLGTYPVAKGKALHLDYEQGTEQSYIRYLRLMAGRQITPSKLAHGDLLFARPSMKLDAEGAKKELLAMVQGYSFCLIDSYRAAIDMDENDSRVRGPLTMLGDVSEETGCVFLVIHHAGKSNGGGEARNLARGSSAIFDSAGTVLNLGKDKTETVYTLTQVKCRTGRFSSLSYRLEDSGNVVEETNLTEQIRLVSMSQEPANDNQLPEVEQKIVDVLKLGPQSGTDLYEETGGKKLVYQDALKALLKKEIVTEKSKPDDKRVRIYQLSEAYVAGWEG